MTKSLIFFGVLGLLYAAYLALALPILADDAQAVASRLVMFLDTAPEVLKDLGVIGEVTPVAIAGLLITVAPGKESKAESIAAVIAVLGVYLCFLHLTVYFRGGGAQIINGTEALALRREEIFLGIGAVRLFAAALAAALIGLWLRSVPTERVVQPSDPAADNVPAKRVPPAA